jgi:RNA polymerase-interacting CarD/CdnL/TRCF family regulator
MLRFQRHSPLPRRDRFQIGGSTVFSVGDQVVHHVHGAGTIVDFRENRDSDSDEVTEYYVIDLIESSIRLSVPVDVTKDRLRKALSHRKLVRVLKSLKGDPRILEGDAKRRGEMIRQRLESGDPLDTAEAILSLVGLEKQTGELNTTETGLLERATSFLAGELALVDGLELDDARYKLMEAARSGAGRT